MSRLRACRPEYPCAFIIAGMSPAVVRDGPLWYTVHYGDEYYFSLLGGHAQASLKGGRSCPLSTHYH